MSAQTIPHRAALATALVAFAGLAVHAALPEAPTDISKAVAALRTAPMITVTTLGKSREGRDIPLITLGDPKSRDTNPALLIVAGLNGDHWIGPDVALGVAQKIAAEHADALKNTTLYIIPRANPDAAEAQTKGKSLRMSRAGTLASTDDDHDRRADEDPPEDLNGDGVISQMRIKNPPSYLKATHILDPDNEGILREADTAKGEVPEYAVLIEGIDNDNDGRFNEDGAGGVDLDMNFPQQWPEHAESAGAYPLSEPESLALAQFILGHPNIEAVLTFGSHDTLVNLPQSGKSDITGRAPLGIENDDKPQYERLSKAFKDITGMTGSPDRDDRGAFWSWAYAQGGVWSFSTPVWARPDLIKHEGDKKDDADDKGAADHPDAPMSDAPDKPEGPSDAELRALVEEFQSADEARKAEMMEEYAKMPAAVQARLLTMAQGQEPPAQSDRPAGGRGQRPGGPRAGGPGAPGAKKKSESDDAKWLALAKERGEGFVEWTAFEHPQLGAVEIGGFVTGFQTNPPADDLDRLVDEQTRFAQTLMDELPRLTFDDPLVEKIGDGVYRISIVAHNTGKLPTVTAIAVKARRKPPLVLRFEGDDKALLAGDRVQRENTIPGGGLARFEWLVAGSDGSSVDITARSPETGEKKITVALRAKKEGAR